MMDAEFQSVVDTTVKIFLKQGELRNVTFIVPSTGSVRMTNWRDEKEKEAFRREFSRFCKSRMVTRFFMTSEAWMTKPEIGEAYVPPADSPKRIECVFIQDISVNGVTMTFAEIFKGSDGKRTLGKWVDPDDDHKGGIASSPWQECLWSPPRN